MRIAVVHGVDGDEQAPLTSVGGLLARRSDDLARDLAVLGHVVDHIDLRPSALRFSLVSRRGRTSTAPVHPRLVRVDASPGRELSARLSSAPDGILAVGEAAGQALDELASARHVGWTWSPATVQFARPPGVPPWVPATASRIITQSRSDVDALARTGVVRTGCSVVPWQLAAHAPSPRTAADMPLRARTALCVADGGDDGAADTVRALAALPQHRLVVAVTDSSPPAAEMSRGWMRLAVGLGVADRVRVVPISSARALKVLLREAGFLVSASRREFQRELVAAAMWCGTPVIATDVDGARELVETGCTGLLLPPEDPRRLARALSVVANDADARGAWVWAARRRVRDLVGIEVTATAVAEIVCDPRPATYLGGAPVQLGGFGRERTG